MELDWLRGTKLEYLPAFATSLAIGLLIGLERERHPGTKAGLRTFALVALFGSIASFLSERLETPWLLVAGLILIGTMIVSAYMKDEAHSEPGTTTVAALLLCYVLAAMVWYGFV
ncbi:MAG: MgtC/SapB family protein, partial [Burkholderiales bacterium]